MGMNTIKLNVGHTQYAGQATFFFYQKSATGVTSTEIDVFVNSGFIARMSPTEHFKISGASNTIDFVPVDPNNTATFITGDVGEEYGTAAVAGTVQVSNFPTSLLAQPQDVDLNHHGSVAFISNAPQINMSGISVQSLVFQNRGSTNSCALTSIFTQCADAITAYAGVTHRVLISLYLPGNTLSGSTILSGLNLDGSSGLNGTEASTITGTITGGGTSFTILDKFISGGDGSNQFDLPDTLILPPTGAILVQCLLPAAGAATTRFNSRFHSHLAK